MYMSAFRKVKKCKHLGHLNHTINVFIIHLNIQLIPRKIMQDDS